MVGVDDGLVWVSYEIRSPSCKSVDNGEKFFVIYIPVSLSGVEGSGKESDGMELAFLIPLLKDGADSISGGVAINRELVLESGLSQDGGGADSVVTIRRLLYAKEMTFKGKDGSTSVL